MFWRMSGCGQGVISCHIKLVCIVVEYRRSDICCGTSIVRTLEEPTLLVECQVLEGTWRVQASGMHVR